MLGSLFNRSQQGGNSSTGGQNVKTSLKSFGSGGSSVGYSEFLGMGQPTTSYGYEGDVYVDLTPSAMSLYGHDGNRWIMWSGPSSNAHLSHPKDSNRWLWCNGQKFGWLPKSGRVIYNQGHSQSELLAFSISKKADEPKKRKSYDAGAPDHHATKKHRTEVREGSTAAHSESHRSPSTSVGPISSATYSPRLPPPNSAARSASYSEPASAHSTFNISSPLIPDERADLLREINDLRVASDLAQRQLAVANEQISQLQADNEALCRELSVALSRILTGAGIPFSDLSSMASLNPGRLQLTPPPRTFSAEQSPNHNPPSSSRAKPLVIISTTPASPSTLNTGQEEPNLVEQRTLLEKSKALIAAAHSQLDDFVAADETEESHWLNEGSDHDDMASDEERNPTYEVIQQSDDEEVREELAGSDDEEVDEELASVEAGKEQPQAEGTDSDTPYSEDDAIEEDTRQDLNSEPDQDEAMHKTGEHVEGYEVDVDDELSLDDDTYNAGLSGQWDDFGNPVPEQNEDGATDTEEDQLFSPQADVDPQSEDDDDGNETYVSSGHAKAERVTSNAALFGLGSYDSDDEGMDATERSASPGTPDVDRIVEERLSIPILEQTPGAEAQDSDEIGSDILQVAINDEQNAHHAPVHDLHVTDTLLSARSGSKDPEAGESRENVSQEPRAAVDGFENRAFMRDETHVATKTSVQSRREDPLTQPGEAPVNQPQHELESLSVSLSQPLSWISQIPLPILFAKTKKYQLCRFCLTATPQIITKFPLALDIPAMEAHCNENHEEYRAVLLDLSPQDLQGLLDADTSAQEA